MKPSTVYLFVAIGCLSLGSLAYSETDNEEAPLTLEDKTELAKTSESFWREFKTGNLQNASQHLDVYSKKSLAVLYRSLVGACNGYKKPNDSQAFFKFEGEIDALMESRDADIFFSKVKLGGRGKELQTMMLSSFPHGPKVLAVNGNRETAYVVFGHKRADSAAYIPDRITTFRAVKSEDKWILEIPSQLSEEFERNIRTKEFGTEILAPLKKQLP